jgi:hypothetical protein
MNPTSNHTTRALIWRVLIVLKFRMKKSGQMNWTAAIMPTSTCTRNKSTANV